jgi:hypothetical protein
MNGWFSPASLHTVIVHTKTDRTIRGLLVEKSRDKLVLRPASIAVEEANGTTSWTKIDGDVVIPLDNVDFWQEGVEAQLAGLTLELFEE